jgi:hypothetical protein
MMKHTYRVLAYLIAAGVALQAAFIAFTVFGIIHDVDQGEVVSQSYEPNAGASLHGITGMTVIPSLAIIFLIVSFFSRIPRGVTWAGVVLGVVLLQVTFAFVAFGAELVGLLHGFNALVLFTVALYAGLRVTRATRSAADAATARTESTRVQAAAS